VSGDEAIRAEPLDHRLEGSTSPLWWGSALLLTIEVVAYGTLVSSYFYLRFHAPEWPPNDAPLPDLRLAGLGTLALLASSAAVAVSGRALDAERSGLAVAGLLAASLLALSYVGFIAADRIVDVVRWDRDAYGSLVWTTMVIHALQAAVLGVIGGLLAILVKAGEVRRGKRAVLDASFLFWHGIVALWLPLFGVFYLLPRIL
jgi:cytochrome c oxidase subunit III